MECSICGNKIEKKYTPEGVMYWNKGNNGKPINNGRCCDSCDNLFVIPARLQEALKLLEERKRGEFNEEKREE
jgi:hypothetical protein